MAGKIASKNWYAVQVVSNFEKQVAEAIREAAVQKNVGDRISQIFVPVEEVVDVRKGRRVTLERRLMPGYVLIHAEMNEDVYSVVRHLDKVSGFLGPVGKPTPMPDREIQRLMNKVEEKSDLPVVTVTYQVGEKIRIIDGVFEGFIASVEDVDTARGRLQVGVSIFGRETLASFEFYQVSKIS